MKEDFLQYAWKYQQFNSIELKTSDGRLVQVQKTGRQNRNAGPDFLDARVRIEDTLWAGNVEVHISASDWLRHGHDKDAAYDNVILHVVFTNDAAIRNGNGQLIPTLSVKNLIDYQTYRYYKSWLKSSGFIPCDPLNQTVPEFIKTSAIQAAAVERLEQKAGLCLDHLNQTAGDIEASFYRVLLRAFGLKVNAIPFEHLSKITPFSIVRKLFDSLPDLEALFQGQAGFLDETVSTEDYESDLKKRYEHLARKFKLEKMSASSWKLFRLRPANFPQVRLAQLARFYSKNGSVAQKIIETDRIEDIRSLFDIVLDNAFWLNHYTFEKKAPAKPKSIGSNTTDLFIVNAVVPFLFALSRYNKDESYRNRAIGLLEQLPPEKNAIVKKFGEMGFIAKSAFDSQGIIQLKHFDCEQRKCLNCKVGIHLLKDHAKA